MTKEKAGCIIVRERNGTKEILLWCQKKHNYWNIPKGHMEEGETREETAIREMMEETGCEVELIKPLPDIYYTDADGDKIVLHTFLAEISSGIPEPESDKYLLEWMSVEGAIKRATYPAAKDFMQKVSGILEK